MKTISQSLQRIDKIEKTIEKIGTFLKTKRGKKFVIEFNAGKPLDMLCVKYSTPGFIKMFDNNTRNVNMIKSAIKTYNIQVVQHIPVKYQNVENKKYQIYLTAEEMKKVNARMSKKLGFAARMHMLENYKVAKYEKKHPTKTEKELKEDLFPSEIIAQRKTQLWLYREYTRNFLCRVYAKEKIRESFYRVFLVYENISSPGTIYEVEGDPYVIGYPMAGKTEKTSIETIKDIIRNRAKMIALRDHNIKEIKVYNKYGKFIASAKV